MADKEVNLLYNSLNISVSLLSKRIALYLLEIHFYSDTLMHSEYMQFKILSQGLSSTEREFQIPIYLSILSANNTIYR